MGSDQNDNSGCLFPFGDDFLPIFMFFFHLNQDETGAAQLDEEDEDDADEGNDEEE
jgi:hypothetical protein